jgi:hypothetical protein
MPKEEDENSICSDKETNETILIKEADEDDDDEDENEEAGEEEEEEEDEEEDDEEEEDDDDEYDPAIIQFELFKNFLTDKEGNNVATHLASISHELRKLNKIAVKILEKK